jgi:hypothetical protein
MNALPSRIEGATLPDSHIILIDDGAGVDATGYTWSITCVRDTAPETVLWTKSTGITSAVGTTTTPALTIAWAAGDMGTLTPDRYRLEIVGTLAGKPRKFHVQLVVVGDNG